MGALGRCIVALAAFGTLLFGGSIDHRIESSKKKLASTRSSYANMDRKLAAIAREIVKNRKTLERLDKVIADSQKEIALNSVLLKEGLERLGADLFLLSLYRQAPEALVLVGESVRTEAERLSGQSWSIRALMKKARLPRLGKALAAAGL